jgi:hypothetical protein
MKFEWNSEKEKRNIKKHAISFDEAVTVFYDPIAATFHDPGHSITEDRFITVGYSPQGRCSLYRTLKEGMRYELSAHVPQLFQRWSGFLGQETGFYKWEIALGS